MRALLPTTTACLLLSPLWAHATTPQSTACHGRPHGAGRCAGSRSAHGHNPPPSAADNDAAARHAKRTACRKNAKREETGG